MHGRAYKKRCAVWASTKTVSAVFNRLQQSTVRWYQLALTAARCAPMVCRVLTRRIEITLQMVATGETVFTSRYPLKRTAVAMENRSLLSGLESTTRRCFRSSENPLRKAVVAIEFLV